MEYTDAKESLLQAARKAPIGAQGFRIQCNKWAVIVRLLLGEIPERIVFMQKGMKKALRPYFELTNVSLLNPEILWHMMKKQTEMSGSCIISTCMAPGRWLVMLICCLFRSNQNWAQHMLTYI